VTVTRTLEAALLALVVGGCRPPAPADEGTRSRALTDALHLVLSADREVYTRQVVNRLQNEEGVIRASEHWKDDKLLPLPAQMFRMGAERAHQQSKALSYGLLSLWPINKQNGPHTDAERAGLQALASQPGVNQYSTETLEGRRFFTAIYPDRAVSAACVDCHNHHPESPRHDFKEDDVMGAMVIRVALD
jgi:hypothetical protein